MACLLDNITHTMAELSGTTVTYYEASPRRMRAYADDDTSRARRAAQRLALLVLLEVVLPERETPAPPPRPRDTAGHAGNVNGAESLWPLWTRPPPSRGRSSEAPGRDCPPGPSFFLEASHGPSV